MNSGQTTAFNVGYIVAENLINIMFKDKVPFETLEAEKSFDENILYHIGIPSKISIKTTWKDSNDKRHEKERLTHFKKNFYYFECKELSNFY